MSKANQNAPLGDDSNKGNNLTGDMRKVFDAFYTMPRTMKEADILTGVMRESICWYVDELEKRGLIFCIGKRFCTVPNKAKYKRKSKEYTTNPKLLPPDYQLKLWE